MISKDNKELADMQKKQLEMLHELDRVCKIAGLQYYLSSGTCLGAVRHKGFIPWDDDIDVYMLWRDAEKLVKCQNLFKSNYFVQCKKTDPNIKDTHYRLRDSNTCMILPENKGIEMNHGIFIDIYILYPFPDNKLSAQIIIWLSFVYRVLQSREGPRNHGLLPRLLGNIVAKLTTKNLSEKLIKTIEKKYRCNGGKKYYATYFGRDVSLFRSIVYPQVWFDNPKLMEFEDMQVYCPSEPEKYCELQYGDNYMQLPPKEKQVPHHEYIFASVNQPYKAFKGEYF